MTKKNAVGTAGTAGTAASVTHLRADILRKLALLASASAQVRFKNLGLCVGEGFGRPDTSLHFQNTSGWFVEDPPRPLSDLLAILAYCRWSRLCPWRLCRQDQAFISAISSRRRTER